MTSHDRFRDNPTPKIVAAATTYRGTTTRPTRRAALTTGEGELLGWVWTDDHDAAGWTPNTATPATAQAGAYVWKVLAIAHRRGQAASVVLDPAPYAPLYQLTTDNRDSDR